jgi:hypothetical protein
MITNATKVSEASDDRKIREHVFVYKTADLDRLYADMKELWEAELHLWVYLRTSKTDLGQKALERLHQIPQIKRELER